MKIRKVSGDKLMNERQKEDKRLWIRQKVIQVLVMVVMGILFYLVMGQKWISIEDDTPFYLNPRKEGVMPVYPLFLFGAKYIFGEALYLDAVVVIQSVLAIICTMIFVLYLEKQFRLKLIETILLYAASMLPFSIYLPEVGITHQILTEGLSYALFYFYFLLLLQYVFTRRIRWIVATAVMAAFMELIRSQMVFLLGVTVAVFVSVEFVKENKDKIGRRIIRAIADCVIGAAGILVVVSLVYKIFGWYWIHQVPVIESLNQRMVAEQAEEQATVDEQAAGQEVTAEQIDEQEVTDKEIGQKEETNRSGEENIVLKVENQENPETMSQFTTLIIIRGFYEIDEEDVELFDDPEMKKIFQRMFDAVDAAQYRYVYARQDLYMWKDLVKDKIPMVVFGALDAYRQENPDASIDNVQISRKMGMKILLHHFDRYLYHSARMMVSGFISSVFFQIERIYLLCHIITLLLYLTAILGSVFCLKKGGNRKVVAFAFTTLGYIFLMVVIINLVFQGIQRYMVYAMGIFYCSLYLLARDTLLITSENFAWSKRIRCKWLRKLVGLWKKTIAEE